MVLTKSICVFLQHKSKHEQEHSKISLFIRISLFVRKKQGDRQSHCTLIFHFHMGPLKVSNAYKMLRTSKFIQRFKKNDCNRQTFLFPVSKAMAPPPLRTARFPLQCCTYDCICFQCADNVDHLDGTRLRVKNRNGSGAESI